MDVNYLLKDELEFELACRGVHIKSAVPVLKKLLKELLVSEEVGGVSYEIKPPKQESEAHIKEIEICATKYNNLSSYIGEIVGKPDKTLFRRLFSRLCHLRNRLSFITSVPENDRLRQEELLVNVQKLVTKLEGHDDLVEEEMLTIDDKQILENTLGELGKVIIGKIEQTQDCDNIEPIEEQTIETNDDREKTTKFNNCSYIAQTDRRRFKVERTSTLNFDNETGVKRKLVPISQWGVKFSGDHKMSINAFIERIDELKEARNATDEDLWRYSIDLFEGDALIWFRANKMYVTNWNELVILLKRTFQKPYFQDELLEEIKKRTQGKSESVIIYISIIQNMFNRLPNKVAESYKINLILKNLQPYYQRAICREEFSSISDLVNVLRIVERTKINCDNFIEPNASKSSLEPDLAFKDPTTGVKIEEVKLIDIEEVKAHTSKDTKKCWNCREIGHIFRNCSLPRQRLFCFKCGKFGTTSKECRCNQGNATGEGSTPAN